MHNQPRSAGARALVWMAALGIALGAAAAAADAPRLSGTVNVNTATVAELQLLPGIGEARAQAVVAERKRRGGFKRLEDLLEVKGIGASSLEQLRPYVTLEGKTTARVE